MKTKSRRLWTLAGLLLIGGAALVYWFHFRPKLAIEQFRETLRAQGEKLSVTELLPPRVPSDQNSAPLLRQATALMASNHNFLETNAPAALIMVAPGKAMVGWMQPEMRSIGAHSWAEVESVIAQDAEALNIVHQIISRPALNFDFPYEQGFDNADFSPLMSLKKVAERLSAAMLCDLHRGDTTSAVTHCRSILALVKGLKDERLVISQLVRQAMAHIAVDAMWQLLQSPAVTESQLASVQSDWEKVEFLRALEDALVMERAMAAVTLDQWRESPTKLRRFLVSAADSSDDTARSGLQKIWPAVKDRTDEWLWRYCWSYSDELRAAQGEQALLDTIRTMQTNAPFKTAIQRMEDRLTELSIIGETRAGKILDGWLNKDMRSVMSQSVRGLAGSVKRNQPEEAGRRMALAALALRRYQLRNGSYPPTLESLAPKYLSAAPRDPVSSRPLRYQVNSDGTYLLYSIGDDGVDNGGDPLTPGQTNSFNWQKGRDWVWPQPATAKQVQTYWAYGAAAPEKPSAH